MKLVDIVGARPQFIKVGPILRVIENHNREHPDRAITEILIHTGQHYDHTLSRVFFEELELKEPDYHLGVGSGTHGYQTGEMLILEQLALQPRTYALATVHRAENTDDPERLRFIFQALEALAADGLTVIVPLHPRMRKQLESLKLSPKNLQLIDPVSYLEMLVLEKYAKIILTDSGVVQKEAFFFRVPCVTLREETERVETVESEWNVL
ncbi:MAG: UDP-N-acetylglucosamine 2-epimerase [Candidatus Bipolaricaulota bacterium]|nr:UDP-N-acetylglucosamine 2-epimerase [Candidatus Bipolaricaulota bacterium]